MLVDGFEREAQRRVENGTFYGGMLFLSLTARKTDDAGSQLMGHFDYRRGRST
jgi:hypothetical protein